MLKFPQERKLASLRTQCTPGRFLPAHQHVETLHISIRSGMYYKYTPPFSQHAVIYSIGPSSTTNI